MIRGIGSNYKRCRPEAAPIIQIADRTEVIGEITVYLREAPPEYVRERQQVVLDVVEKLETAGILDNVSIVRWPPSVHVSRGRTDTVAGNAYQEFTDAVGSDSLEPFFKWKPVSGRSEDVLVLPTICITLRSKDDLTGLYPHWDDGTHHSIEDCLQALSAGESIANV